MERLDELITALQGVQTGMAGLQDVTAAEAAQLEALVALLTAPDIEAQAKVDQALGIAQQLQASVQQVQTSVAGIVTLPEPPAEPQP